MLTQGAKVFQVDVGSRKEVISADRLKPHMGTSPVQPGEPPRRGRPPASEVGDQGRPPEVAASGAPARGGRIEWRRVRDKKYGSCIVVSTLKNICLNPGNYFNMLVSIFLASKVFGYNKILRR